MDDFDLHQEGEQSVISLPAILDLAAAEKFLVACQSAHEQGQDLLLSGQNVEKLGTGCAQVMLSAAKTLEADGHRMQLAKPSEALSQGLIDLGFADLLEKWSIE